MRHALVDANNIATTAFSVSGELRNSKGVFTGTTLTTIDILRTALEKVPDICQIIFAWDSHPSWRHEFFDGYKANRTPKSSRASEEEGGFDWYAQKKQLQLTLSFLGIPQVQADLLEADDIAGLWMKQSDYPVCFVSNDKDWYQVLQNPNHILYQTLTKRIVRPDDLEQVTSCTSMEEYVSMKSITGDPGDGIPGVYGVGPSTALQYLRGTMNKKSKRYEKIEAWMADEEGYRRSRVLYELGIVPMKTSVVHTSPPCFNEDEVRRILEEFEAKGRLYRFDEYIAPFRKLNEWMQKNGFSGEQYAAPNPWSTGASA